MRRLRDGKLVETWPGHLHSRCSCRCGAWVSAAAPSRPIREIVIF